MPPLQVVVPLLPRLIVSAVCTEKRKKEETFDAKEDSFCKQFCTGVPSMYRMATYAPLPLGGATTGKGCCCWWWCWQGCCCWTTACKRHQKMARHLQTSCFHLPCGDALGAAPGWGGGAEEEEEDFAGRMRETTVWRAAPTSWEMDCFAL